MICPTVLNVMIFLLLIHSANEKCLSGGRGTRCVLKWSWVKLRFNFYPNLLTRRLISIRIYTNKPQVGKECRWLIGQFDLMELGSSADWIGLDFLRFNWTRLNMDFPSIAFLWTWILIYCQGCLPRSFIWIHLYSHTYLNLWVLKCIWVELSLVFTLIHSSIYGLNFFWTYIWIALNTSAFPPI